MVGYHGSMWQTAVDSDMLLFDLLPSSIRSRWKVKGECCQRFTTRHYLLLYDCSLWTWTLIWFATIHLEWCRRRRLINGTVNQPSDWHLKASERPRVFTFSDSTLNPEPLKVLDAVKWDFFRLTDHFAVAELTLRWLKRRKFICEKADLNVNEPLIHQ